MEELYVWPDGNYCEYINMNVDVVTEFGYSYQVLTPETTFGEIMQMSSGTQEAINNYFKDQK